jgi:hypothetical protein
VGGGKRKDIRGKRGGKERRKKMAEKQKWSNRKYRRNKKNKKSRGRG